MASEEATKAASSRLPGTLSKLPRIPQGGRIEKRPLTRRQPPASSKSRIIYVSSRTPFMAVVKRARKQLDAQLQTVGAAPKSASLHSRVQMLERAGGETNGDGGVVTVMGTGRAVERALAVASWFEQQGDCQVELRTRTVGTIDDVVVEDEDVEDASRLRKMSCLEVSIKLK
ncbi:Rpp20 subunit of nuclear RNase MRP and P-domain-containing protein [Dactylonectria macrodidyma]|uniref:Rpp20 subunit of nuclear RNase MRP and P-domain-containing protein n=1 Tax=Dactylonectria macrodidyma TaxID=307937 RepID=A0A9P9FGU3_9HYPO|nr:Rpp20 subunit of nuclear RNase MRP and P-domain-containing protein [Dactylonectria macrodidyma]